MSATSLGFSRSGRYDQKHEHDAEEARARAALQLLRGGVAEVDAHHHDVAVREVDELQHAVDHGVAEGHERVDRAGREAIDEVLDELGHLFSKTPAVGARESKAPVE
jgi:hypothetical protein